jgi:hypothetical protein
MSTAVDCAEKPVAMRSLAILLPPLGADGGAAHGLRAGVIDVG